MLIREIMPKYGMKVLEFASGYNEKENRKKYETYFNVDIIDPNYTKGEDGGEL